MILKSYGINTAMVPAGGWRYMQPTTEGEQRIPFSGVAPNSDKLVEMVRDYRAENRIPLGDPAFDVADYIRKVSPINNRWSRSKKMEDKIRRSDQTPKNTPLIERIGNWLAWLAPRRPKLVSLYDAKERVPACQGCRHNVKWATKCLPCIEKVETMAQNVRQVMVAEEPDQLLACRLHDLHLPAAVFIDVDHLPERNEEAPPECWLRPKS